MLSVSIVTVSNREYFLRICLECVLKQNYPNIIEWIVINTTMNKFDNDYFISKYNKIKIHNYCMFLSDARNLSYNLSSGEIVIVFDDDDIYPPNYVSNVVSKFNENKNYQVVACLNINLYNYSTNQIYEIIKQKIPDYANQSLSFRKQYLYENLHESGLKKAEETSILCNLNEEQIGLIDGKDSSLLTIHGENTVNKQLLLLNKSKTKISDNTLDHFLKSDELKNQYLETCKSTFIPIESNHVCSFYYGMISVTNIIYHNEPIKTNIIKLIDEKTKLGIVHIYSNNIQEDLKSKIKQYLNLTDKQYNNIKIFKYYKFACLLNHKLIVLVNNEIYKTIFSEFNEVIYLH